MHSLDRNVSFFTQNPFAPRELPRFAATMGSSDSCDSFRPAGLPSSRQNFPDTPPFYAPPCFPRQKSSLALLFGFTHYETLAAWVVGVTGRNSEGSLALRLIRLYDRASTVESPLPWPVILSDRRFLIRVNTFQFTSSAKFAWRTINPRPLCQKSPSAASLQLLYYPASMRIDPRRGQNDLHDRYLLITKRA